MSTTRFNKQQAHGKFVAELQNFLTASASPGAVLTVREIKLWVRALPETHPLIEAYALYRDLCGHRRQWPWELHEFNRLANHMKYLPGFYREIVTHKRVNNGAGSKYVKMHRNKVKIS